MTPRRPWKANDNRREHDIALQDLSHSGWAASTTPLKIYEERRQWLVQTGRIALRQRTPDLYEGTAVHPTGITMHYSLIRDPQQQDAWGVYLDRARNRHNFVQKRGNTVVQYDTRYRDLYEPLLAMTNPPGHRSWPDGDFRNAVTGDYDLIRGLAACRDLQPSGR